MKRSFWVFIAIALLSLLPVPGRELVDLITGQPAAGAAVHWPLWRYFIEPFAGSAEYVLSFTRYIVQLLSWLGWISLAVLTAGIVRKRSAVRLLMGLLYGWAAALSVFIAIVLLPFPAPRLTLQSGMAVDLHSHTDYSHDGVVSPVQSLRYHRALGFTAFYDTEHGHTDGFTHFPERLRLTIVFPGMQVSTTERVSLLVLADKPYDGREFRDKSVQEVIDLAHRNGFAVLCPHWWKWRYFTWDDLRRMGIDGFEVYNAGYRKFSEEERRDLIRFCVANNLFMAGTTDWHGWGKISDVWTVIDMPAGSLNGPALASYIRERKPARVITYRRPEVQGMIRYLFEPFVGLWYYFGSLNLPQLAGWLLWCLVCAQLPAGAALRLKQRVPAAAAIACAGGAVFYLIRWVPLLPENSILGKLLAPILAVLAAAWFLLGKYYGKISD